MPSVGILIFSAAAFLVLCVAVSVPFNKPLLVQQKRKSNIYLNCIENRKICENNFEKLEFGLCSSQSWPGWNHGKIKDPSGNISALFYEPVGPDGEPELSGSDFPNGSPGQNGYPGTGTYPWPHGLTDYSVIPDPNPFGTEGQEHWFTFGHTHLDDRLVAQDQRWWQFSTLRDASVTIQYPLNGYDANTIISYVLISVTTDNVMNPNGYIIGGGISQSFIEINIYVYETRLFGWTAQIYAFH